MYQNKRYDFQFSFSYFSASTAIQTPNPKDSSITLPSVRTDSKQLSTGPSVSSVPPPASHYYSNYSKNQPSTQGKVLILMFSLGRYFHHNKKNLFIKQKYHLLTIYYFQDHLPSPKSLKTLLLRPKTAMLE